MSMWGGREKFFLVSQGHNSPGCKRIVGSLFSPSQMQGWRWKKFRIASNGSVGVPWPPLIPPTSGSSVGGSHMVDGSPFGRSLVLNRDITCLRKVLWLGRDGRFGTRW